MPLLTQGWQAINLDANDSLSISATDGAARISIASGALAGQTEVIPRGSWTRSYTGPAVLNVQHIAGVIDWNPAYRAELGASNGASVSLPVNPSSAALYADATAALALPGGGRSSIFAKLRASAAAASAGNLTDSPPWTPAPAWQPNTGYMRGAAVTNDTNKVYISRGLIAGSSGGLFDFTANPTAATSGTLTSAAPNGTYFAIFGDGTTSRIVTITGGTSVTWTGAVTVASIRLQLYTTSAGAGGPTGTGSGTSGSGQITDNQIQWEFLGPVQIAVADPDAPTVSWVTSSSGYVQVPPTVPTDNRYNYIGGLAAETSPGVVTMRGYTSGAPGSVRQQIAPCVEFFTDSTDILIQPNQNPFPAFTRPRIAIDNRWLNPGTTNLPSFLGANVFLRLQFPTKRQRRIRYYITVNAWEWRGVFVRAFETVWKPYEPTRLRIAFAGSSMFQGAAGLPDFGIGLHNLTGTLIGQDDVWNLAVGSTGLITNNSGAGTNMNHPDRIQDLVLAQPDIIIGQSQDGGVFTSAENRAALTQWVNQVQAVLPNATIVWGGIDPASSSAGAPTIAAEAAYAAAMESLGASTWANPTRNSRLFYTPMLTDPSGSWLTGTGNQASQNQTGNSDWYTVSDGLHCSIAGTFYRARRWAGVLRDIANRFT